MVIDKQIERRYTFFWFECVVSNNSDTYNGEIKFCYNFLHMNSWHESNARERTWQVAVLNFHQEKIVSNFSFMTYKLWKTILPITQISQRNEFQPS